SLIVRVEVFVRVDVFVCIHVFVRVDVFVCLHVFRVVGVELIVRVDVFAKDRLVVVRVGVKLEFLGVVGRGGALLEVDVVARLTDLDVVENTRATFVEVHLVVVFAGLIEVVGFGGGVIAGVKGRICAAQRPRFVSVDVLVGVARRTERRAGGLRQAVTTPA